MFKRTLSGKSALLHNSIIPFYKSKHDPKEASQAVLVVKNLPANTGGGKRGKFKPWVKIPWRRGQQATPAFLRGEANGQVSLVGYSP